jgi:hypothetical protein
MGRVARRAGWGSPRAEHTPTLRLLRSLALPTSGRDKKRYFLSTGRMNSASMMISTASLTPMVVPGAGTPKLMP